MLLPCLPQATGTESEQLGSSKELRGWRSMLTLHGGRTSPRSGPFIYTNAPHPTHT